jgi:predicted phosphodiesterase
VDPTVLVHLSDIHFTGQDNAAAERNRAVRVDLMRDLELLHCHLGDATAVVVTGDIAFSGATAEYQQAAQWLDSVAALVGSANCQILTVPGNHDVYWPSIQESARISRESLRTCPVAEITQKIDRLLEDPTEPLLSPLRNYNEFALRYRCEVGQHGRPWQASIPLRNGYHLAVRGLTSVFNSDVNDTDDSLVIGRTQTALPRDDAGAVYLLLAHHGPENCRDRQEIRDRIKDRARALLCGHLHEQRVQPVNNCIELVAGAVHPEEEPGWHPTYNWIVFDIAEQPDGRETLVVDIHHRVLRPEWNEFRSGTGRDDPDRIELPLPSLPVAPAKSGVPPVEPSVEPQADQMQAEDEVSQIADMRPPLLDEEGQVDAERQLTHALLELPVSEQERILDGCGLLAAEDKTKDHVTMILDALGRLTDETRIRLAEALGTSVPRPKENS